MRALPARRIDVSTFGPVSVEIVDRTRSSLAASAFRAAYGARLSDDDAPSPASPEAGAAVEGSRVR